MANSRDRKGQKEKDSKVRVPRRDKLSKYAMAGKCWEGPENDPSWYVSEEAILRDAASLSYANLAGVGYKIKQNMEVDPFDGQDYLVTQEQPQTIPGIMTFNYVATFGQSHGKGDSAALTSMVRALYSYVRHANSGSKNYEAPDLGMYLLAVDQIYMFIAEMQRIYGILNLYSRVNRYYGKRLVNALGFDYDDLITKISDFRAFINTTVYKASSLAVPANFSVFARHIWLANNYFSDSQSGKANIYAFVPHVYARFSGRTSETGSELIYDIGKKDMNYKMTLSDLQTMGNQLLGALLEDEDIGIMSGDILKAFGQENLAKLALIDENYQVMPVHSIEVLTQIQNLSLPFAKLCDPCYFNETNNTYGPTPKITQADGYLISEIALRAVSTGTDAKWAPYTAAGLDRLLSVPTDSPTPADTMVATRLTNIPYKIVPVTAGASRLAIAIYPVTGTELITQAWIHDMTSDYPVSLTPATGEFANLAAKLSAFDFHPYVIAYHSEGDKLHYIDGFMFESDNYTVLTSQTLEKMHNAAVIGEIYIRSIALAPNLTKK